MDSLFNAIRRVRFRRGPRRILGGIGGGIVDATGWDPVVVRLLMVLAALLPLIGPTLYVALWVLLPWQDGTIPLERLILSFRENRNGSGPTVVQE